MEIVKETKVSVIMTQEERETLKKAVDILVNLELEEDTEIIDFLEEVFEEENEMAYLRTTLANSIDYIGMLLEKGGDKNED